MPSQILFFWNDCANRTRMNVSTSVQACQYKIRETKKGMFRAKHYTFTTADNFFCKLSNFFHFQLVVKDVVKVVVKISKMWSKLWSNFEKMWSKLWLKLLSCQILFVLLSFSACAPNFLSKILRSKILGKD